MVTMRLAIFFMAAVATLAAQTAIRPEQLRARAGSIRIQAYGPDGKPILLTIGPGLSIDLAAGTITAVGQVGPAGPQGVQGPPGPPGPPGPTPSPPLPLPYTRHRTPLTPDDPSNSKQVSTKWSKCPVFGVGVEVIRNGSWLRESLDYTLGPDGLLHTIGEGWPVDDTVSCVWVGVMWVGAGNGGGVGGGWAGAMHPSTAAPKSPARP